MKNLPLKKESIIPRIDGIMRDIERMRQIGVRPFKEFADEEADHFDAAKARLREALEGVFNIGAHILSRLSGGRVTEYKEIAFKLGELGIVKKEFSQDTLVKMAGYRNRLTHFYAEISEEELYDIIKNRLGDFENFLSEIKKVLEHPEHFGLTVE